jgi:hypothetical protein
VLAKQRGATITSSLSNLCDGLLDRDAGCPPNHLLVVELIVALPDAVEAAAKELKGALQNTEAGAAGQHGREAPDCEGWC